MAKIKRNITAADRKAAENLRFLWEPFARQHRLSQATAGSRVGLSQSLFSQYLRCEIPMGYEATLRFAKLLGVAPTKIRPDYELLDGIQAKPLHTAEPTSSYGGFPEEALDIARAWLALPPHRRQALKDQLFIDAAVARHCPWLSAGKPASQTYAQFEQRVQREMSKLKGKQSVKA